MISLCIQLPGLRGSNTLLTTAYLKEALHMAVSVLQGERQNSNCTGDAETATHPVPESERVLLVDPEFLHQLQVGAYRHHVLRHSGRFCRTLRRNRGPVDTETTSRFLSWHRRPNFRCCATPAVVGIGYSNCRVYVFKPEASLSSE